ncbi:Zinc finger AN1 and C2H2 domain-containing stress-associated protein 16-like protein [Drosera capensis]
MGTPEFPNLGKHCFVEDCKQIDFLPFTCDTCRQVFCLDHRSYSQHNCPRANKQDVTVVVCPLCAKGVRLIPEEDPNITWEAHVNTECDPSNYEKATKKRKCPVPGCRELLTFSNSIKCRDCNVDHCLKHRFGPDHKCPGPTKPGSGFLFTNFLTRTRRDAPNPNSKGQATTSSTWARLVNAASSVRASAEASMAKLSTDFTQVVQSKDREGQGRSGTGDEACPQCDARFSSVTALVDHVKRVHENGTNRTGARKVSVDVCPKCSRGFRDPVSLVEHVEKDHGGSSRS